MESQKHSPLLENPRIDGETERVVKEALSQRKTLLLIGSCRVDYKGRANSRLELGERVVMIKEDG
jgi:RecB family endonuclease NucS